MSDAVTEELDRLRELVGRMERRIAELERGPTATSVWSGPAPSAGEDARGRRGLLRLAGVGLAGAAVATVARPTAASAACGPALTGACTNTTSDETVIKAGWNVNAHNRPVLSVQSAFNESTVSMGEPMRALHGSHASFGVVGAASNGVGVDGTGGVNGVRGTTSGQYAVLGTRNQTTNTPDGTAGVLGEHLNTDAFGTGVIGSHAGAGWGMWAKSVTGIGIHADGGYGTGAEGVSKGTSHNTCGVLGRLTDTNPSFLSAAVRGVTSATGFESYGVEGIHAGPGGVAVRGRAANGTGVNGLGKVYGVSGETAGALSPQASHVQAGVFGYLNESVSHGSGVRGLTNSTSKFGSGVKGESYGPGFGVRGICVNGSGVEGSSSGVNANTYGVVGRLEHFAPAAGTAGVYGVTTAENNDGYGVYGNHPATGIAVYGRSAGGIGVRGATNSTTGSGYGVHGTHAGTGTAVYGQTAQGVGVRGFGGSGRGGVFTGAAAQVNLTPGALATHPTRGTRGDLYVDSTGRLWFCKTSGSAATWAELA